MSIHKRYHGLLMCQVAFLKSARNIPDCRYEKWDETGYSRGLQGEQMLLSARPMVIWDVWDTLTSDRTYGQPGPRKKHGNTSGNRPGNSLIEVEPIFLREVNNI